jgi:hypothetical protein
MVVLGVYRQEVVARSVKGVRVFTSLSPSKGVLGGLSSLEKLVFGTVYTAMFVRADKSRRGGVTEVLMTAPMVAFIYWGNSRPHDTIC